MCDCSWCDRNRTISTLRQIDPPDRARTLERRTSYPSKSKKVWRDRFHSARLALKRDIDWYIRGRENGYEDKYFYKRIQRSEWSARRYREARCAAKAHGAIA